MRSPGTAICEKHSKEAGNEKTMTSLLILPALLAKVLVNGLSAGFVTMVQYPFIFFMFRICRFKVPTHYYFSGVQDLSRHKKHGRELLAKVQPCK